jgi:hypothetical protein
MAAVTVTLLLSALHVAVHGPRLRRAAIPTSTALGAPAP